MKKVILTGDRPTGNLHLGHYFGSLKKRIELQDEYDMYIIIADVQALTDNFDNPQKVRDNVREVLIDNLSVGLDPNKVTFFIQSMIPEIAELTVYFSNLVTMQRLYRNPTVKSEIEQKTNLFGVDGEKLTYGFVGYPVSQAADILAFGGEIIPVGEDQIPVIEQTREIVRKFNNLYGPIFKEPEALLSSHVRIKGLDGQMKMGKSLNNAIFLTDDEATVIKKVRATRTDPNKIRIDDPGNPDICMVYYYHKLFSSEEELKKIYSECVSGERGCALCKQELIKTLMNFLNPIQERRKYYEEHPEIVDKIIQDGTEKARKKAQEIMKEVRKAMKIDYFN